MVETLLTAAGAFAATNLDALMVLAILFLAHRAADVPKTWKIWAGQYLGLGAIVAVSVLAALGLAAVPFQWVGLLGLVPVALGVRGLVRIAQPDTVRGPAATASLASVAAMALANGGDNIAVYVPLFHGMDGQSGLLTVAVFAVLIAVWCTAASWLTMHPKVIEALGRWGHWAVPVLYIAIGATIVVRSGVFALLIPG